MSSILKALKKLEEERAGRVVAGPPGRAGGQFVAPQGARPWLLIAGGVGCGLLLAGAAYLLSGRPESLPVPSPAPGTAVSTGPTATVANTVSATASPGSPPPGSIKSAEQRAPVAPAPAIAASPAKAVPVPPAPAAARPAVAAAPPASARPPVIAPEAPPSAVKPPALPTRDAVKAVQVERREIPAPGQQWAAPDLTVSDILPASGGGRMAIVNGLPVMEGTMVDDAVVREIRPDQVVFEIDGKSVAVPLAARP